MKVKEIKKKVFIFLDFFIINLFQYVSEYHNSYKTL